MVRKRKYEANIKPTDTRYYLCRKMPEWQFAVLDRLASVHKLGSVENAIYYVVSRSAEARLLWGALVEERKRAAVLEAAEAKMDFGPPVAMPEQKEG